MDTHTFLLYSLVYLTAAVIAVSLARRWGLGSVLGYLLAGILIGPHMLAIVGEPGTVMRFAEFGVVMMLFLIGLELRPERLWKLRKSIFGLGSVQVILCALCALVILWGLGQEWRTSLAIGLILALSSTAMVLQSLQEKHWLRSTGGQYSFSVLLFQDIAVIPMLILFPLLAVDATTVNLPDTWDATFLMRALLGLGGVLTIVILGYYATNPLLRFIAATGLEELFTACTLMIIIGIALLMDFVGLSPVLGTFLAGVVLAESAFRIQLERTLAPFKGLLLGLFFITIGASIDFALLANHPWTIGIAVFALVSLKCALLWILAYLFRLRGHHRWLFALALAQGGEFAFVLATYAMQIGVIDRFQAGMLNLVVALSMLCTPLLLIIYQRLVVLHTKTSSPPPEDSIEPTQTVIITGFGRFGQVVGRLLIGCGYHLSILDHNPQHIALLRRFGNKVHFGDASRADILAAAGAHDAQMLVIAVGNAKRSLEIVHTAQQHFPNLKLLVRAIDRRHTYELMRLGVTIIKRDTFGSALAMGVEALKNLGMPSVQAEHAGKLFAEHDEQSLAILAEHWGNDKAYGLAVRRRLDDLAQVLRQDQRQRKMIQALPLDRREEKT